MYLGITKAIKNIRADRWIQGIGTFSYVAGVTEVEEHAYACDACGRRSQFTEAAVEPFYCRNCNLLISIEGDPNA